MTTRLTIDGAMVRLHQIDLVTDGSRSSVQGYVDFSKWPEQGYEVDSALDFKRMREIYFPNESWRVNGNGRFKGTFRLFQKGGHELKGQFTSPLAMLDTPGTRLDFPRLYGSLLWAPDRFAVTDAGADFYGGPARFSYARAAREPGPRARRLSRITTASIFRRSPAPFGGRAWTCAAGPVDTTR